jgi:hypothetical protein
MVYPCFGWDTFHCNWSHFRYSKEEWMAVLIFIVNGRHTDMDLVT